MSNPILVLDQLPVSELLNLQEFEEFLNKELGRQAEARQVNPKAIRQVGVSRATCSCPLAFFLTLRWDVIGSEVEVDKTHFRLAVKRHRLPFWAKSFIFKVDQLDFHPVSVSVETAIMALTAVKSKLGEAILD